MVIGKLWYGAWKDYKKIREFYDIDFMVSICRYPPYRYYGSVVKTQVLDFRHLGPSAELHRWRREKMETLKDPHDCWTEYAQCYQDEIGNREADGKTNEQYQTIIDWVRDGKNVCMLCTCPMGKGCHRYLLWQNMVRTHKLPYRGSSVKLDWTFAINKVTDLIWEHHAIIIFQDEGRVGKENAVMLACPHVEMSAAYDRLIKKGIFGKDRGIYLKSEILNQITKGE